MRRHLDRTVGNKRKGLDVTRIRNSTGRRLFKCFQESVLCGAIHCVRIVYNSHPEESFDGSELEKTLNESHSVNANHTS